MVIIDTIVSVSKENMAILEAAGITHEEIKRICLEAGRKAIIQKVDQIHSEAYARQIDEINNRIFKTKDIA
jgi:hypothetical protein